MCLNRTFLLINFEELGTHHQGEDNSRFLSLVPLKAEQRASWSLSGAQSIHLHTSEMPAHFAVAHNCLRRQDRSSHPTSRPAFGLFISLFWSKAKPHLGLGLQTFPPYFFAAKPETNYNVSLKEAVLHPVPRTEESCSLLLAL